MFETETIYLIVHKQVKEALERYFASDEFRELYDFLMVASRYKK